MLVSNQFSDSAFGGIWKFIFTHLFAKEQSEGGLA